ncbi:VanZ family protein [Actinacidiphila bryophytorum]|uniref:Integral membrane protein n=1 Tax=Actinacidiphila bryophytorum TaxID=1436133 RepID=A0A9W4E5V0_9ACTN|nr:VanZ family protein [Actinacidiphila bryophytorum]MBM9436452.1 VanZ family protein [Actinacidiphila bryophytorum]MBN6546069.1 VanZ family protein [Actinacidiphila bryophytorum]CAG7601448.1 putative integral membrane protein [Actinacidiphila bryophytorum]
MQHEGSKYRVRAAGLLLTAAYLAFAAWLLLRPHYVAWVPSPNLRPFSTIRADLRMEPAQAARHLLAGLGLLAPLGILLPMAGGRIETSGVASFVRTVFAGLMVSMSVEFTQTMVPGQLFDVDALILNTAGVALAHLLVVPAVRRRLRQRLTLRAELARTQEGAPQGRGELRAQPTADRRSGANRTAPLGR